ncbi:prolipoprotein diacylglyceryl transferase [Sungkyunkwania multivorans]|uniref:Phosphatidylglycerol--prolipoprotein diacylglyceryl transferase n=1 Tax=Sungkyunkwania multivorans TaxID=1173618 RepID=A0ABW3CSI3_9FLAO
MTFLSIVWDPNDTLFEIGNFPIKYYGLMWMLAFVLGFLIIKNIFKKEGQPLERLDPLFMYTVLSIMIGARLGHVLFYQTELIWQSPLEVFLPIKLNPFRFTGFRGLASHGAAIGAVIGMYLYKRKYPDLKLSWILDRLVIPSALGAVFVRFGNFMNSEIVGEPTNSDYGVIFKQLGENFPRHPAQLYEAIGYVFVFLILYFIYYKTDKGQKPWYLFGLFFVLLMTVRFFAEFFKRSQGGFESALGVFTTGQWLSIPFIIIGLYLMFRKQPATA